MFWNLGIVTCALNAGSPREPHLAINLLEEELCKPWSYFPPPGPFLEEVRLPPCGACLPLVPLWIVYPGLPAPLLVPTCIRCPVDPYSSKSPREIC